MAQIGDIACTYVRGRDIRVPQQRGELWHVSGVDGIGSMQLGVGGAPFAFDVVYYGSTVADVQLWHANLSNLVMTVVSIIDDFATTHTYALVHQVAGLVKSPVIVDGVIAYRGETSVSGVFTTLVD